MDGDLNPNSTLVVIRRRMKKPIAIGSVRDGYDPLPPKLGQKLGKIILPRSNPQFHLQGITIPHLV